MKYTICFLFAIFFLTVFSQVKPKYRWIVHHSIQFENLSAHMFDAKGRVTNRYKTIHVKDTFYTSPKAWTSFWDKVVKRNGKIVQGGVVIQARIDSVKLN